MPGEFVFYSLFSNVINLQISKQYSLISSGTGDKEAFSGGISEHNMYHRVSGDSKQPGADSKLGHKSLKV